MFSSPTEVPFSLALSGDSTPRWSYTTCCRWGCGEPVRNLKLIFCDERLSYWGTFLACYCWAAKFMYGMMQIFETTIPSWGPDVAQFFTSDSWPTVANWLPTEWVLGFVWLDLHGMVPWRMKSHHFPEVQTDCVWCEQDNGADTGPACAHLAMMKACSC